MSGQAGSISRVVPGVVRPRVPRGGAPTRPRGCAAAYAAYAAYAAHAACAACAAYAAYAAYAAQQDVAISGVECVPRAKTQPAVAPRRAEGLRRHSPLVRGVRTPREAAPGLDRARRFGFGFGAGAGAGAGVDRRPATRCRVPQGVAQPFVRTTHRIYNARRHPIGPSRRPSGQAEPSPGVHEIRMSMNPASSPCVKRQGARRSDASAKPKTDEPRPLDRSGKARCAAGHPAARIEAVVRGIVRRGLKPDACAVLISLRLDEDVFEWFKAQGPGYQARINAVWRAFRDASARGGCRHPSRPAPSPQSPALAAVTSPRRSHQPSPQAPAFPAGRRHSRADARRTAFLKG